MARCWVDSCRTGTAIGTAGEPMRATGGYQGRLGDTRGLVRVSLGVSWGLGVPWGYPVDILGVSRVSPGDILGGILGTSGGILG